MRIVIPHKIHLIKICLKAEVLTAEKSKRTLKHSIFGAVSLAIVYWNVILVFLNRLEAHHVIYQPICDFSRF